MGNVPLLGVVVLDPAYVPADDAVVNDVAHASENDVGEGCLLDNGVPDKHDLLDALLLDDADDDDHPALSGLGRYLHVLEVTHGYDGLLGRRRQFRSVRPVPAGGCP